MSNIQYTHTIVKSFKSIEWPGGRSQQEQIETTVYISLHASFQQLLQCLSLCDQYLHP